MGERDLEAARPVASGLRDPSRIRLRLRLRPRGDSDLERLAGERERDRERDFERDPPRRSSDSFRKERGSFLAHYKGKFRFEIQ